MSMVRLPDCKEEDLLGALFAAARPPEAQSMEAN